MSVLHPERWNIVWNVLKDNITKERDQYKDIGLCGFDYKLVEEEEGGGVR